MTKIYFDNAAATQPLDEVVEKYIFITKNICGNPSSLHKLGVLAENEIIASASVISKLLGVSPNEIIFTSGGTESNNLAMMGTANATGANKNIVTTAAEHPSVLECCKALEMRGFEVTYLKTDLNGHINLHELQSSINTRTVLVSVVHVNNETGAIQNIFDIGNVIKSANKNTLFHVDGVQSFGKHPTWLYKSKIDLFSFSSHKIHGLKGVGGLFIKKGTRIAPIFYGGGQQNGIRPGTENVAGIVSFAEAARIAYRDMDVNLNIVSSIRNELLKIGNYADITINGDPESSSPYILNLSFTGCVGEILLNALSEKGISVSTGSACNGRRSKDSVITRMGLPAERANSAVRFSFSRFNTVHEAEKCVEALKKIIPQFLSKKIMRKK